MVIALWLSQLGAGRSATNPRPSPSPLTGPRGQGAVQDLIASGNLIGAIKLYREQTGLGLKESKEAVEAMAAGRAVPPAASVATTAALPDASLEAEVRQRVRAGELIDAIKLVRQRTGLGLKEAKDFVERMQS